MPPTSPVCIVPRAWNDDFRGLSCHAYGCVYLAKGHRGTVCNCTTHLLKLAHKGYHCALGDEWRVMHRLLNVSCVPKPYPSDPKIDHRIVRARRLIRMTPIGGRQPSRESVRGIRCTDVKSVFSELARHGLRTHDSFIGNFRVTRTAECPISVLDLEEYLWPRDTSASEYALPTARHQPWIANQTRQNARPWRNANCISFKSMFPCLDDLCRGRL